MADTKLSEVNNHRTNANAPSAPVLSERKSRASPAHSRAAGAPNEHIENFIPDESARLLREERAAMEHITEMRSCSHAIEDFFYLWPRFGLFWELLSKFFIKVFMYLDMAALVLFAFLIRDKHSLTAGCCITLVMAPLIASWTSGLILCEGIWLGGKYRKHSALCAKILLPVKLLIPLYLFLPAGLVFIVLADLFSWVSQTTSSIGRWFVGQPLEDRVVNTSWAEAFPRQRRNFHLLCQSLPELVTLLIVRALGYSDDVNMAYAPTQKLGKEMYWFIALVITSLNILIHIGNCVHVARDWDIGLMEYLLPTFRLFGGLIPGFGKIIRGGLLADWTNFAFGRFTYIQFVEILSRPKVKLATIDISRKTLRYLPQSICFQFGDTLRTKNVDVNICADPSAKRCFRAMDERRKGYISLETLKEKLPMTGKFKDVDKEKLHYFFNGLSKYKRVHYSRFRESTRSKEFKKLLYVDNPMTLVAANSDHRLYKFMLGLDPLFLSKGKEGGGEKKREERVKNVILNMVDKQDAKFYYVLRKHMNESGTFTTGDWMVVGDRMGEAIQSSSQKRIDFLEKLSSCERAWAEKNKKKKDEKKKQSEKGSGQPLQNDQMRSAMTMMLFGSDPFSKLKKYEEEQKKSEKEKKKKPLKIKPGDPIGNCPVHAAIRLGTGSALAKVSDGLGRSRGLLKKLNRRKGQRLNGRRGVNQLPV